MLDKLSFSQKMKFSIILFSIPLLALGFLVFKSHQTQIESTKLELNGTRFQRPLMHLLFAELLLHRLQSKEMESQKELDAQIQLLVSSYEKFKIEFQNLHDNLGFDSTTLQKYGRPSLTETHFDKLVKQIVSTPRNPELTEKLITLTREVIRHSNDTSALILDPDLDSYYLMDATSIISPQLLIRLSAILEFIQKGTLPSGLSTEERFNLIQKIGFFVDGDFATLKSDLEFSVKSDAEFYGSSPSLQTKVQNISTALNGYENDFAELRSSFLNDRPIESRVRDSFQNMPVELLSFWEIMNEELERLLVIRTDSLISNRNFDLSLTFGIWLASCIFALSFSSKLSKVVCKVAEKLQELGLKVTSESAQIKSNSQMLSSTSVESAAALQESVATIEEINSMVAQTASSCSSVDQLSKRAVESAHGGQKIFNELVEHMTSIGSESSRIEQIISVIEDITFQINLLALNAAVEAARAGEQGRGFSIVAENVRVLAQKSATASKGINDLIKNNVTLVKKSNLLVNDCRISLDSIAKDIRQVAEMNHDVARSTQEQSSGLKQLSIALNGIDQKTQSNASASEFLAQSSLLLDNENQHMTLQIETLSGLVNGGWQPQKLSKVA